MATARFVEDFVTVIAHLRQHYPEQWPEDQVDELVEEAKGVARDDMEGAELYYGYAATCIRAEGWHC